MAPKPQIRLKSQIAKKLLRWYGSRERSLPWRQKPEPYAVWVAEIMAQQTRLESMLPYYARWMKRFPTIRALANADEQEVLALWEGLGYYSRGRNLRRAAKVVMADYGGKLPEDLGGLHDLPGVGPYTAGAIASLAFGVDAPAVDGNAIRVLARVFNVEEPVESGTAKKRFWELAAQHLPSGHAADYNQALMDLGAQVCLPRRPKCSECPLKGDCVAKTLGIQEERPVKRQAKPMPLREFAAAVIRQRGEVLLVQRPASGLLAGMWEFPNTRLIAGGRAKANLKRALRNEFAVDLFLDQRIAVYEHTYSHFQARLRVYECKLSGKRNKIKTARPSQWVEPIALRELPMGKLDRNVANLLHE